MALNKLLYSLTALALAGALSACMSAGTGQVAPSAGTQQEAQYPPYSGPKKRIAVLPFDNKVNNSWWDRSWNIEQGLTEQVITELMKTNRFIVVERTALDEVLKEQDLGEGGRVRGETAARIGELLGAQVLVKGVITEFIEKESGGMGGIAIAGIGIGGKVNTGHVAIDLRLIDATTGQVLQSHRAEGKITSTGIGGIAFFHGVAFGGSTYKKTALGQATRQAIGNAVRFVMDNMESRPWEGRIVKVEGNRVYINGGSNMNIVPGAMFTVYAKGADLTDPDTGLFLGATLTRSGEIRIVQVEEKFSLGETVSGSSFSRGDVLKMQ